MKISVASSSSTPSAPAVSAPPSEQAAPPQSPDHPAPAEKAAADSAPKEKVALSAAAESILRETRETAADTVKEAQQGDIQAKHLVAKQAAAKAAKAPPVHVVA